MTAPRRRRKRPVVAAATVDWSALPGTALELISLHLAAYSAADYFRFCSVCSSWRSAASPRWPHLPWVVGYHVSESDVDGGAGVPIYSAFAFTGSDLSPPAEPPETVVPSGALCFGSSRGWLALIEPDSRRISLWKPVAGVRVWLPLLANPAVNIPDKLVLSSSDPATSSDCVILLSHRSIRRVKKLSFCRPGDMRWTPIRKGSTDDFFDIAFHNGRFYLAADRRLYTCNLRLPAKLERIWPEGPLWRGTDPNPRFYPLESYLIHSRGELLLVILDTFERIMVVRLDFVGEKFRSSITDLGDLAVFVGKNHSFAVRAEQFPGCERNCVYRAHDKYICIKVFNLEDRSKRLILNSAEFGSKWSPCVWITPMLSQKKSSH